MKVLAMDLGLTDTGWVLGDAGGPTDWQHGRIRTPARRKGQDDSAWNLARFSVFGRIASNLIWQTRPDVVAYEVTKHAFGSMGGRRSTKGIEYRAGYALGRAAGWMDGVAYLTAAYGITPPATVEISSFEAKLRTTGNAGASKDAVRVYLEDTYACDLKAWSEAEVDALAVLTAFHRNLSDPDLPGGVAPSSPTLKLPPALIEGQAPSPLLTRARTRARPR